MSTFEIPRLDIDVEVRDQDRNTVEVDGVDFNMCGEDGTLEVIIMGNIVDSVEQDILDFLEERGLTGSVSDVENALIAPNIIELIMAQSAEVKLDIVKAIMKEM